MCYNKQASLNAFIIGIVSSLLLIFFGNNKYKKVNRYLGIFFIFISFMQLFDYMMWIDKDCTTGYNSIAGKLGSLFILLQPIVFYLIFSDNKQNNLLKAIIIIYTIYILILYTKFLKTNTCSMLNGNRIKWIWDNMFSKYYFHHIYILIAILVMLFGIKHPIKILGVILLIFTFAITYLNYKKYFSEFWCYFSNMIPLIILIIQKLNLI